MKYTLAFVSFLVLSSVLYAHMNEALYEIKVPVRETVLGECGTEFDKLEFELYQNRLIKQD